VARSFPQPSRPALGADPWVPGPYRG